MQITLFSLFMSVVWSSVLVIFSYFCRKRHYFIRQFGITSLLFLYLFSLVRMFFPYQFPFTKGVSVNVVLAGIYNAIYLDARDAGKIPLLFVLFAVWAVVSAALIAEFIIRYAAVMKRLSSYSVCEDEQCTRIFRQVADQGKKRMKIAVRRSGNINVPMGIGLSRKSIILPDEDYSDADLYYILRHEYTHFQNHDLAIKIMVHIFCCIFWWNPAVYLLKKDLSQTLEIKCDLSVTAGMRNSDKARYLSTIVTTLKKAEERREEKVFYGVTALVSKSYQSETVERFKIVSGNYDYNKNKRLTALWFLIFIMVAVVSYSFVIHPSYEPPITEIETGPKTYELTDDNSYLIKHVNGAYSIVMPSGREQDIDEKTASKMISQGFEMLEEETK